MDNWLQCKYNFKILSANIFVVLCCHENDTSNFWKTSLLLSFKSEIHSQNEEDKVRCFNWDNHQKHSSSLDDVCWGLNLHIDWVSEGIIEMKRKTHMFMSNDYTRGWDSSQ